MLWEISVHGQFLFSFLYPIAIHAVQFKLGAYEHMQINISLIRSTALSHKMLILTFIIVTPYLLFRWAAKRWPRRLGRHFQVVNTLIARLLYSETRNEIFNITGLRPKSAVSLNDIISHREPNYAGADPTPLLEEWIGHEDFTFAVNRGVQGDFRAATVQYRTKREYVAKNEREQGTAFVSGIATIKAGSIRTRQPRGIFLPFFYIARLTAGLSH